MGEHEFLAAEDQLLLMHPCSRVFILKFILVRVTDDSLCTGSCQSMGVWEDASEGGRR